MSGSGWVVLAMAAVACAAPPVEPLRWSAGGPRWEPQGPALEARPSVSTVRTSTAPPRLALSVEQATLLALQNNADLRVRSFGPVVAGTFEQIERGVLDPELFARAQYQRERASQTARATGERFDVEGSSTDVGLGIRQRFSTGTDVELELSHQLDESDRTPQQQQARVGLTVTQAFLRGFGPAVNLAAVEQASLEYRASRFELRGFTETLIADTERAYWTLALAAQEIEIFERSLAVARREEREIAERIDVGLLPELEVAAARAEVARREQGLIDARSRLQTARLQLNRLVSPDSTRPLDAVIETVSDPRVASKPVVVVGERVQLADQYRPDLAEARLRQQQRRLAVVVTRNGLLPQLDVFVSVGKSGFSDDFGGSLSNLGEPTYDLVGGLRLSQLLGNRAAEAQDIGARASYRQAGAAVENLRQVAMLQVHLAANEVARARAQIDARTTTRRLQQRAVQAEKERFAVGAGTGLLVAQAQRDLLSSQIEEVRAVVDYRLALVQLYEAEGTLLLRRGITVDE